jgi:hypothetical protein
MVSGGQAYVPHVHAADAYDFGTRADLCDLLRRILRLGDVASDDAGVCAEVNERASLGAADVAGAAGHESDPIICWSAMSAYAGI